MMYRVASLLALVSIAVADDFPKAEITNGTLTAKFYLPDPQRGYYRGTRFDWSGVISSLRMKNHEYFGQWFEKYDPKLHDAIMGPVEEFRSGETSVGYDEAKAGETFVRIGIGLVRKPDEPKYNWFKSYEIVDPGKWTVKTGPSWIEFTHQLRGGDYAYAYKKTVRLLKGAEMSIEHSLTNTGKKRLQTSQYNHNFFVMDGQPTGPDARVMAAFELKPMRPVRGDAAEPRGKEIVFTKELQKGQSFFGEFEGTQSPESYDFRLEHRKAGMGVRIRGDKPLQKLVFWSIRSTFCPEPYIDVSTDPGKTTNWTYTYSFYESK